MKQLKPITMPLSIYSALESILRPFVGGRRITREGLSILFNYVVVYFCEEEICIACEQAYTFPSVLARMW